MANLEHLNQQSDLLVLELINRANTATLVSPLTFEQIKFSNPAAITDGLEGRNTRLTVSRVGAATNLDEVPVEYWRIHLGELFKGDNLLLPIIDVPTTIEELITALNNFHGLALSMDDVVDTPFDSSSFPVTVTLTAQATSYAFIGEVELTITQALDAIIVNAALDGLKLAEAPIITVGEIQDLKENGDLHAGTGLKPEDMLTISNSEVEIFVGSHRRGAPNAYVTPVDNVYDISLTDDRLWSFTFGAALLDQTRGTTLTELYDVSLTVSNGTDEFTLDLVENEGSLVWSQAEQGPIIVDNAPVGSLTTAHNSQQLMWYAAAFPSATFNTAGAVLGNWTFTMRAKPIRAIWMPPLEIVTTTNIEALPPQ